MANRIHGLQNLFKALLFGAALSAIFNINAQRCLATDFESPRTAALGGSGHAGPLLNDAIYMNPSYTAFLPSYSLAGNYGWANYGGGSLKYKIQNLSIQDGRAELFQAGAAYTHRDDGSFFHLGAGKSLISGVLGVGVGGKAYFPSDGSGVHMFDSTVSTTFAPLEWAQAVLVVDNIAETAQEESYNLYREIILGTKFNVDKMLLVYVDPHYVPDLPYGKYGYEAGAEIPMMNDFFLRGGMFRNAEVPWLAGQRGRGFGLGVGWLGPRLSLDYGLSRLLQPITGTAQVIGCTIFM